MLLPFLAWCIVFIMSDTAWSECGMFLQGLFKKAPTHPFPKELEEAVNKFTKVLHSKHSQLLLDSKRATSVKIGEENWEYCTW